MQTITLILSFGFVACILAQRGPGAGGAGGHGGGADKFPQSCKTDADNAKQCVANNVRAKGVNVNIEDVQACFKTCQRPAGGANGGNRPEGFAKGGFNGQGGNHAGANGNFSQVQAQMKTYEECIKTKLGDKQEQCVNGKTSYAVAPKETTQGGQGGHGMGGMGNPLQSLSQKVAACGAQTETCVRAAMGTWYDKADQLSQILCDASTACPQTTSAACAADRKAGQQAECQCRVQLQPDVDQAKKDCTTPDIQSFVDRMGSSGNGQHQQPNCDAQDVHEERPRPSPFCPRPAGQGQGQGAKGQFAKFG